MPASDCVASFTKQEYFCLLNLCDHQIISLKWAVLFVNITIPETPTLVI